MCTMRFMKPPYKSRASGAQQRSERPDVADLLHAADRGAELFRAGATDHRRRQIEALRLDLGARHRIPGRAPDGPGMVPELAAVLQADLHDAFAAGHGAGQGVVAPELDAPPHLEHLRVAHARRVV